MLKEIDSEYKTTTINFANYPYIIFVLSRIMEMDSTEDTLPYWYLNQNGDGVFDSASATVSKIVFIDDNQSPYVEIVMHFTQNITKNHNNGTEKTQTDKTWEEYTFYVPKTIMQYNLNK